MLQKELRRLNRKELVDIIYQLKKNEEENMAQITRLEEALQEKRLHIANAGSIAEAATDITGVFTSAQSAANLYLQEIDQMKEDARKECEKMIEEAKRKVELIFADGKKQYETLGEQYELLNQKRKDLEAEIKILEQRKNETDTKE